LTTFVVERAHRRLRARSGIDFVVVIDAHVRLLAAGDDVVERRRRRAGGCDLVQDGVEEAERAARRLVGIGDEAREQRRGQARAAYAVLVVVSAVWER